MAEEEEYTVEKILDKRTRGGKTEYLIKWEGYPDRYDNFWCIYYKQTNSVKLLFEASYVNCNVVVIGLPYHSFSVIFRRSENTWEPDENLDCPEIISAFEEKLKAKKDDKKRKKDAESPAQKKKSKVSRFPRFHLYWRLVI